MGNGMTKGMRKKEEEEKKKEVLPPMFEEEEVGEVVGPIISSKEVEEISLRLVTNDQIGSRTAEGGDIVLINQNPESFYIVTSGKDMGFYFPIYKVRNTNFRLVHRWDPFKKFDENISYDILGLEQEESMMGMIKSGGSGGGNYLKWLNTKGKGISKIRFLPYHILDKDITTEDKTKRPGTDESKTRLYPYDFNWSEKEFEIVFLDSNKFRLRGYKFSTITMNEKMLQTSSPSHKNSDMKDILTTVGYLRIMYPKDLAKYTIRVK